MNELDTPNLRFPRSLRHSSGDPTGHHRLLQIQDDEVGEDVRTQLLSVLCEDSRTVLLSSEGLFPLEAHNLGALRAVVECASSVSSPEIWVTFREPAAWALSWSLQLILQGDVLDVAGWADSLSFTDPITHLAEVANETQVPVKIRRYTRETNKEICADLGIRWQKPRSPTFATPNLTEEEWSTLATMSAMIPRHLRFESLMWAAEALIAEQGQLKSRRQLLKPWETLPRTVVERWIAEYVRGHEQLAEAGVDGSALLSAAAQTKRSIGQYRSQPEKVVRAMQRTWPDAGAALAPALMRWRNDVLRSDSAIAAAGLHPTHAPARLPESDIETVPDEGFTNDRAASRRIAISGPGRAGTSLLVRLFAAWGFSTAPSQWHSHAQAGMESRLRPNSQYEVDKDPWAFEYLDQQSGVPLTSYGTLIVPIRDRRSVVLSRSIQERFARAVLHGDDSWHWDSFGATPGGAVSNTAVDGIQNTLGAGLWDLLVAAAASGVNTRLLSFPKFAVDFDYLWQILGDVIEERTNQVDAREAWALIVDPDLIRISSARDPAFTEREKELMGLVEMLRRQLRQEGHAREASPDEQPEA